MKSYHPKLLKFALVGILILNPTLISAMDTIPIKTRHGIKMVKLNDCPQWFLESEAKQKGYLELSQQALQILKTREEQKLRAVGHGSQPETPKSFLSSSSQSSCLSNQNGILRNS